MRLRKAFLGTFNESLIIKVIIKQLVTNLSHNEISLSYDKRFWRRAINLIKTMDKKIISGRLW